MSYMDDYLSSLLRGHLPKDCRLALYHFCTELKAAQGSARSHCFVALQDSQIVYAIEILAYNRSSLTTLYVSKVDSTGCHDVPQSPISAITLVVLIYLVTLQSGPVRLCLFARAQPQYIFPFSAKNPQKHLLDDNMLIKWWIKRTENMRDTVAGEGGHGYLLIPGEDEIVSRRHVSTLRNWKIGHPYSASALAVDEIMSFPDDPKSRFLADLKAEKQDTTMTVAQFWNMMAYRQEMSFGHAIGFICVEVVVKQSAAQPLDSSAMVSSKQYKKLFDALQSGVYASAKETRQSTTIWLQNVETSKVNHIDVVGTLERATNSDRVSAKLAVDSTADMKRKTTEPIVNTLVPRKKKKKSGEVNSSAPVS